MTTFSTASTHARGACPTHKFEHSGSTFRPNDSNKKFCPDCVCFFCKVPCSDCLFWDHPTSPHHNFTIFNETDQIKGLPSAALWSQIPDLAKSKGAKDYFSIRAVQRRTAFLWNVALELHNDRKSNGTTLDDFHLARNDEFFGPGNIDATGSAFTSLDLYDRINLIISSPDLLDSYDVANSILLEAHRLSPSQKKSLMGAYRNAALKGNNSEYTELGLCAKTFTDSLIQDVSHGVKVTQEDLDRILFYFHCVLERPESPEEPFADLIWENLLDAKIIPEDWLQVEQPEPTLKRSHSDVNQISDTLGDDDEEEEEVVTKRPRGE